MKITAWQLVKENDILFYRVQVDNPDKPFQKRMKELFRDWNISGSYSSDHANKYGLLFTRGFLSKQEWCSWAKKFPYSVEELSPKVGVEKVVAVYPVKNEKPQKNKKIKTKTRGKRICRICGKSGHDSRNCPQKGKGGQKKKKQTAKKRLNRCSKCGKLGHNSRTCKG